MLPRWGKPTIVVGNGYEAAASAGYFVAFGHCIVEFDSPRSTVVCCCFVTLE